MKRIAVLTSGGDCPTNLEKVTQGGLRAIDGTLLELAAMLGI